MTSRSKSINELASAIRDNERRGKPRLGCDCMQCFGYCLIDSDAASREAIDRRRVPAVDVSDSYNYEELS